MCRHRRCFVGAELWKVLGVDGLTTEGARCSNKRRLVLCSADHEAINCSPNMLDRVIFESLCISSFRSSRVFILSYIGLTKVLSVKALRL